MGGRRGESSGGGENARKLQLRSSDIKSNGVRRSKPGSSLGGPSEEEKRHKVNTQVLKDFVREQKQTMKVLRQNDIFNSYLKQAAAQRARRERREDNNNGKEKPYAWEDGSEKGATLALIQRTAEKQNRDKWGVWSSFGKPYVQIVERSLEGSVGDGVRKIALQLPEKVGYNDATEKRKEREKDDLLAAAALAAEAGAPEEEEWVAPRPVKMTWSTEDRREVEFPRLELSNASTRRRGARTGGGFVDGMQAVEDAAMMAKARESPVSVLPTPGSRPSSGGSANLLSPGGMSTVPEDAVVAGGVPPVAGAGGAGAAAEVDDNRPISSVSMYKAMQGGQDDNSSHHSSPPKAHGNWGSGGRTSELSHLPTLDKTGMPIPARSASAMAYVPGPDPDDSESPVLRWRKQFIDVRKECASRLAMKLERREERRLRARTDTPFTSAMSGQLMADMRQCGGRVSPNPFTAHRVWQRAEKSLAASKEPEAFRRLGTIELQLIERFYEQLCALVEKQKVSDPVSVAVVYKVKTELEAGCILERGLLVRVCEHLGQYQGVGPTEGNPFLMPILQFIRKCTGVGAADLDGLVRANKISHLLPQAGGGLRQDTGMGPVAATPSRFGASASAERRGSVGSGRRRGGASPSPAPMLRTNGDAGLPPRAAAGGGGGGRRRGDERPGSSQGRGSPAPLPLELSSENLKGYKTLQKAALQ